MHSMNCEACRDVKNMSNNNARLGVFFRTKLFQEGRLKFHFKFLKQTLTRGLDFVANLRQTSFFLFIVLSAVSVIQIKDCSKDTVFTRTVFFLLFISSWIHPSHSSLVSCLLCDSLLNVSHAGQFSVWLKGEGLF